MLIKLYGETSDATPVRKYSPSECIGTKTVVMSGDPEGDHISTSHVERSNLRMHMRRFTRLTNGFYKKLENHVWMVVLYTVYYNWIKIHKTLRVITAMKAGLSNQVCRFEDLAQLIEVGTAKLEPRGPYKKKLALES